MSYRGLNCCIFNPSSNGGVMINCRNLMMVNCCSVLCLGSLLGSLIDYCCCCRTSVYIWIISLMC